MSLRNYSLGLPIILLLGLSEAANSAPIDLPIARGTCDDRQDGRIDLLLSLRAREGPMDARSHGEGWDRSLVLEATAVERGGKPVEVWRFDDHINPVPFPPPRFRAQFLCDQYAAGKELYALIFVLKASLYEKWEEARFYKILLPFGSTSNRDSVVTWEEHIPRLPLRKEQLIDDVEMFWEKNEVVILLKGARAPGSTVFPMIRADLPQKSMTFYPGNLASRLGAAARDSTGSNGEKRPQEPRKEWFECSYLRDCSIATDECGKVVGIRQDSRLQFFDWIADLVPECKGGARRPWQCEPSLACIERKCSIRWFGPDSEVNCEP